MVILSQELDHLISGRYTVPAPHKTGAGIGVSESYIEHNRALAVFLCALHCYTQIMVGRAGAEQSAPGSMLTGYANPVRLTTSAIGVSCGEFSEFNIEAAIMATVPTITRLNDEDLHKLNYVTTALRALRKITLSDPQEHQVLVETLINLQAERIRVADKANLHIHRLLNISGGHRNA
ncbi:immunity protein [Salmonella enterica subsp. enterica serovar Mountpleasant]|nr:immunity protein [Salmonella enterica subsp. enterica serovar Mountpleasant]